MKFLLAFACALAVASATHVVAPVHPIYPGAQHLPVIGANGVPVDTPAVQHATAAHLAHKVEAHARNGDYHHQHVVAAAPITAVHTPVVAPVHPIHHPVHPIHHPIAVQPEAYPTTVGVPSVTGDGVPLETPEVVAAKSAHFAAHGEALARTGHAYHHYVKRQAIYTPYATTAYATPYVHHPYTAFHGHHHYLAKRQVYTPYHATAYTTPFVHPYATYGHHYLAKRQIYTPTVYGTHAYTHGAYHPYAHYY